MDRVTLDNAAVSPYFHLNGRKAEGIMDGYWWRAYLDRKEMGSVQ
jgi:hypothetical protein